MPLPRFARRRANILLALSIAALFPVRASAQLSTTRGFSFGAHLQGTSLTVENGETNSGGGLALRAGYGFNRLITGFLHIDGSQIEVPSGGDIVGQWNLAHAELGARFHFANSLRRWVPYVEASAGTRVVTVTEASVNGDDVDKVNFNGGALTFGGGLSTFFRKTMAVDVSLKWSGGTFTEIDLGNVALRNLEIEATSFRFGVGVIWWP